MNYGNSETLAATLATFCSGLSYEDLSPKVVDWAKYLCLDFAGVALNGSTTESARTVVKAIESVNRPGPSVIIGTQKRALPEYAAMANGTAFHSLELDDIHNDSSIHGGVIAFPTALAMADVARLDGRNFVASVVAGYEVMMRLGMALKPAEHYKRGFHPDLHLRGLRRVGSGLPVPKPERRINHRRTGCVGQPGSGKPGIPDGRDVDQATASGLGRERRDMGGVASSSGLSRAVHCNRGPLRVSPRLLR